MLQERIPVHETGWYLEVYYDIANPERIPLYKKWHEFENGQLVYTTFELYEQRALYGLSDLEHVADFSKYINRQIRIVLWKGICETYCADCEGMIRIEILGRSGICRFWQLVEDPRKIFLFFPKEWDERIRFLYFDFTENFDYCNTCLGAAKLDAYLKMQKQDLRKNQSGS